MTMRKLMATGLVAVAGVLAFTADAQAFGKRKKNKGGCNDCATAAPVHYAPSGCGGCGTAWAGGPGGYAMAAPDAMPATGTAATTQPGTVVPASGTTGGTVVPATGTTQLQPQSYVVPAGGYYLQNGRYVMPAGGSYQGGQYVSPAGYGTFQSGFGSGVIQGAFDSPSYVPFGTTVPGVIGNYAGQQAGRGLFRRR